jgi:hypothetical protein
MEDKKNSGQFNPFSVTLPQAVQRIREIPAREDNSLGYYLWHFIQNPLPHSDPGDVREYTRLNGNWEMRVNVSPQYGYPYGALSRILLCWIVGESIKNYHTGKVKGLTQIEINARAKHLKHGNMNGFLNNLGINSISGGKEGSITIVKKHFLALVNAQMHFDYIASPKDRTRFKNITIGAEGDLLWSKKKINEDEQNAYLRITHQLCEVVFGSFHPPIPIDLRAVCALRNSPLAIDLYVWLTYKMYHLGMQGKDKQVISWSALKPQFGAGYSRQDHFTQKAKKALKKIALLYPAANYTCPRGRIVLYQSSPHIPVIQQETFWYS